MFTIVWQYLNWSRFDRVIIKCTLTHLLDHNVQTGYYTVSNHGVGVKSPTKSKDAASRKSNVRQHKSETYQQLIERWHQQAGSSIYHTHTHIIKVLLLLTKSMVRCYADSTTLQNLADFLTDRHNKTKYICIEVQKLHSPFTGTFKSNHRWCL